MKLEWLIQAAGFNPMDFPTLANVPIEAFDRKDREIVEPCAFAKPLFSENLKSRKDFQEFLKKAENKCLEGSLNKIWIRLEDDGIMIFYPSLYNPKGFFKF